jgi:hypothetical protein
MMRLCGAAIAAAVVRRCGSRVEQDRSKRRLVEVLEIDSSTVRPRGERADPAQAEVLKRPRYRSAPAFEALPQADRGAGGDLYGSEQKIL